MTEHSAIITGASQGLGLALSEHLIRTGYAVIGVHRGRSADPRWKQLVALGHAREIVGSAGADDTVKAAFAAAGSSLSLVINCAGVGVFGSPGRFHRRDIDASLEANLVGTILFADYAFHAFRERGGSIVNIMSTASLLGRANETLYCAAKWGARGYTEALRVEAKGTKTRIYAIYPGGMNTPFWAGSTTDSSKFMDPAEVAEIIVKAIQTGDSLYVSDITINRG